MLAIYFPHYAKIRLLKIWYRRKPDVIKIMWQLLKLNIVVCISYFVCFDWVSNGFLYMVCFILRRCWVMVSATSTSSASRLSPISSPVKGSRNRFINVNFSLFWRFWAKNKTLWEGPKSESKTYATLKNTPIGPQNVKI